MSLKLKTNNFYFGELLMFLDNTTTMPIHSDDKKLFRKCIQIWDMINELTGINDPRIFVETTSDDEDEFFMLEIEKNASAIIDKYRNDLVFVFKSVFNNFPLSSLVQDRY